MKKKKFNLKYFRFKREFLKKKGIILSLPFNEEFKAALNTRRFCSRVLALNEKDFSNFKFKLKNLFFRIDSLGYTLNLIKNEEKDLEKFIEKVYHPDMVQFEGMEKPDFVVGGEEPTSLIHPVELFLLTSASALEYLAQVLGSIFGNSNIKKISVLEKLLKTDFKDDKLALSSLTEISKNRDLWTEIQEDGVRNIFENIDPDINQYEGKNLVSIIKHYRPIKMTPTQMTIGKNGRLAKESIKAGSYKRGNVPEFGNETKGIVPIVEKSANDIICFVSSMLKFIYEKA